MKSKDRFFYRDLHQEDSRSLKPSKSESKLLCSKFIYLFVTLSVFYRYKESCATQTNDVTLNKEACEPALQSLALRNVDLLYSFVTNQVQDDIATNDF